MASFVQRMIRAAKLDPAIYEEVENDRGATGQAMAVVLLASAAAGIGLYGLHGMRGVASESIAREVRRRCDRRSRRLDGLGLRDHVHRDQAPARANHPVQLGELLRTLGFSSSPGILRIVGVIGGLGGLVVLLSSVWMLIAMVVAVRQALDYRSTWRAIGVCLIGFALQCVVVFATLAVIGVSMRSMFG